MGKNPGFEGALFGRYPTISGACTTARRRWVTWRGSSARPMISSRPSCSWSFTGATSSISCASSRAGPLQRSRRDNRYTRAAGTLERWLETGVLTEDDRPASISDEHRFSHQGRPGAALVSPAWSSWKIGIKWSSGPTRERWPGPKTTA